MKRVQVVKSFKKKLICAAIAAALGGSVVGLHAAKLEPFAATGALYRADVERDPSKLRLNLPDLNAALNEEKEKFDKALNEARKERHAATDPTIQASLDGKILDLGNKRNKVIADIADIQDKDDSFRNLEAEIRVLMTACREDPWLDPLRDFEHLEKVKADPNPARAASYQRLKRKLELHRIRNVAKVDELNDEYGLGLFSSGTGGGHRGGGGGGGGGAAPLAHFTRDSYERVKVEGKSLGRAATVGITPVPSGGPRPDINLAAGTKPGDVVIGEDYKKIGSQLNELQQEIRKLPGDSSAKAALSSAAGAPGGDLIDVANKKIQFEGDGKFEIKGGGKDGDGLESIVARGATTVDPKGHLILSGSQELDVKSVGEAGAVLKKAEIESGKRVNDVYAHNVEIKGQVSGIGDDAATHLHAVERVYLDGNGDVVSSATPTDPASFKVVSGANAGKPAHGEVKRSQLTHTVSVGKGQSARIKLDSVNRANKDARSSDDLHITASGGVVYVDHDPLASQEVRIGKVTHDGDGGKTVTRVSGGVAEYSVNALELKGKSSTFSIKDAKLGDDKQERGLITYKISGEKIEDKTDRSKEKSYHSGDVRITGGHHAAVDLQFGEGFDKNHTDRKSKVTVDKDGFLLGRSAGHLLLTVQDGGQVQGIIAPHATKGKNEFKNGAVLRGATISGKSEYGGDGQTVVVKPSVVDERYVTDAARVWDVDLSSIKGERLPVLIEGKDHTVLKGSTLDLRGADASSVVKLADEKRGINGVFKIQEKVRLKLAGDVGKAYFDGTEGGKLAVADGTLVDLQSGMVLALDAEKVKKMKPGEKRSLADLGGGISSSATKKSGGDDGASDGSITGTKTSSHKITKDGTVVKDSTKTTKVRADSVEKFLEMFKDDGDEETVLDVTVVKLQAANQLERLTADNKTQAVKDAERDKLFVLNKKSGLYLDAKKLEWREKGTELVAYAKPVTDMKVAFLRQGLTDDQAMALKAHTGESNLQAAMFVEGELNYHDANVKLGIDTAYEKGRLAQLSNEVIGDIRNNKTHETNIVAMREFNRGIEARLNTPKGTAAAAAAAGDTFESGQFWGRYIHSDGKLKNKDDVLGYSAKLDGITLGLDGEVNDQVTVGFAFSYAKSDTDTKDISQSTKGDYYAGTFYGGWTEGPWFMNGMLSYLGGKNDYKSQVDGRAYKGDGDIQTWGLSLGGGYNLALDENREWILQPRGEFNYQNSKVDDYQLKGDGVWEQKVKLDDYQVYELGFGARVLGEVALEQGTLMPEFRLMGYYDFNDEKNEGQITTVNGVSKLKGKKREQGRGVAGLGLAFAMDNNFTLGLDYDYDFSGDYSAHSIMAKLSYEF